MKAALVAGALLAACDSPMSIDEMSCPDTGTQLTYESFGGAFLAENCNSCHYDAKNGAPRAFQFDSVDQVRQHADRIFIRSAGPNLTMPPGPKDPPGDERDKLAEWLACGAP